MNQQVADLIAAVTAEQTVVDGAVTLINGFAAQITAAVAAAVANGVDPAQLQAITDATTAVTAESTKLSSAVAANTPAVTP